MHNVTADQMFSLPHTRSQAVADQLRAQIMSGALEAGTPLRQVELARRFGVSTTPVREAFAALLREGLVVGDTHRGVVVFHPSVDDLRENYEIRIALEPLATAKAAGRITDAEVAELEGLLGQMRRIADPIKLFQLNRTFHARIYEFAARPRLASLIESLRDAGHAYGNLFAVRAKDRSVAEREHEAIVLALKAKDPATAAQAMADHLRHNADFLAGELSGEGEGSRNASNGRAKRQKVSSARKG